MTEEVDYRYRVRSKHTRRNTVIAVIVIAIIALNAFIAKQYLYDADKTLPRIGGALIMEAIDSTCTGDLAYSFVAQEENGSTALVAKQGMSYEQYKSATDTYGERYHHRYYMYNAIISLEICFALIGIVCGVVKLYAWTKTGEDSDEA